MVTGIILASGNGNRFGADIPKQFVKIKNVRVLDFSVQTFLKCKKIDELIIVVHPEWVQQITNEYPEIRIVPGGETRQNSSFKGLKACSKETSKVLIHDGARPFVSEEIIQNCISALENHQAVSTAISVVDTIVKVENNTIIEMPNRAKLWAEQTPQGFDYKTIKKAHKIYTGNSTDDIRLVLDMGIKPFIVEGNESNFKITNQSDLKRVEMIIEENK
jgi:2-C-methyl-D-erythritol 4-phosphate cytidylyltransferase